MLKTATFVAATLAAFVTCVPGSEAQIGSSPRYDQLGGARAAGEDPTYHVNRYGFGNCVQGPNGSYCGYPAGSAGAIELQNEHDIKCRYAPETC